ncbi:MAG: hypothetical protein AAF661_18310 [Pseudomonadota bacterium]
MAQTLGLKRRLKDMSFAMVVLCGCVWTPLATSQTNDAPQQGVGVERPQSSTGQACLTALEPDDALQLALVSIAPAEQCAPTYQVVELRNISGAALGDVRFTFAPSTAQNRFSFDDDVFEISTDDGATWSRVGQPIGAGTDDDPLVWSAAQAPQLARLGAAGDLDDSILMRWRATFGEGVRAEARLWLGASAADACGALAETPVRPIRLPLLRAELLSRVEGRNASRNGEFGPTVSAAPGDEVEWRLEVENVGEALAREVRLQLTDGEAPIVGLTAVSDGALLNRGVLALSNLVEGGRRTALLRETVGPGCVRRVTRVEPSWGCVAPPPGRGSGLRNPFGGESVATLDTAPTPEAVKVLQRVVSVDGVEGLGDLADVVITIEGDGPPVFDPEATVVLPDGYVLDTRFEPRLISATGRFDAVLVDSDRAETPRFRLRQRGGGPAYLNQGDSAQISFRIARVRSSRLESDVITSTVGFRDACDQLRQNPPERLAVSFRQPDLTVSAGPVGDAIVGGDAPRQFRVDITNTGDEAARRIELSLRLGPGWATLRGAGCELAENGDAVYRCDLGRDLAPGDTADVLLELRPGEQAGSLDLSAEVAAYSQVSGDEDAAEPLQVWAAGTGGVGFNLRQVLRNRVGAQRNLEEPLDLGELVSVDVEARWFGVADEQVTSAAITQRLPSGLGFLRLEDLGGDLELEAALTPAVGESGQILWSLRDFRGSGVFNGRVHLEVIGGELSLDARDAPVTLTPGAVDADAVFTLRDIAYGVDPLGDSPTNAGPLRLQFRRPDIRLDFDLEEREAEDGAYLVDGGERLVGLVRLRNLGGAPGFLDWISFSAQPPFSIEPFSTDLLDNDFDGQIDEPDEGSIVIADLDGAEPSLRWISLRDAATATVTGSAQRVDPGFDATWRFALRVAPEVAPDSIATLRLDGQFDASPFSQDADGDRQRVSLRPKVRTPRIRSFLVLSDTSLGQDLSEAVGHGEQVDHRLTVRFPPSAMDELSIEIDLPPAYQSVRIESVRLGSGMLCDAIADPEIVSGGDPSDAVEQRQVLWRLGRCVAVNDGDEGARSAILDLTGVIQDVDPNAAVEERDAWRSPAIIATIAFSDPEANAPTSAEDAVRRRVAAGESRLRVSGGVLRSEIISLGRRSAGAPFDPGETPRAIGDAGDRFEATLLLTNVGDAPLKRPWVSLRAPGTGGIDCVSVRIGRGDARFVQNTDLTVDDTQRACGLASVGERVTLDPGEEIELQIDGRLAVAAPIAATLRPKLIVGGESAADAAGRAIRGARSVLAMRTTEPKPPEVQIALAEGAPVQADAAGEGLVADGAVAAIGDVFRIAARHTLPEGRADASLEMRFRLADGATGNSVPFGERETAAPDAFPVSLLTVALGRERGDLTSEADPGGVNGAPPGERGEVLRSVQQSLDDDGWMTLTLPLGDVGFDAPGPQAGEGAFVLEAAFALADTQAATSRRVLQMQAATRVGERRFEADLINAGRIVEPFLELAAISTDVDGVARPGDRFEFHALACNRGESPAYGITLEGVLPDGAAVDPSKPARFERVVETGLLSPPLYGDVRRVGGRVIAAPAGPAAALAPEDCLRLRMPIVMQVAPDADGDAVARFEVTRYLARPSANRPGRTYRGGASAETRIFGSAIAVDAPEAVNVRPGAVALYPFSLQIGGLRPAPLRVAVEGSGDLEWVIHRDLNGDGVLDNGDAVWRAGDLAPAGERITFIARAEIPADAPVGWRETGVLRALAITEDGARLSGVRELAAQRASDRAGAMVARRLMAVDRDCDGLLDNERTQDAVFEPVKEAAPGECVVMRIEFSNEGGVSVEQVNVDDVLPGGVRLLEGSPRFVETPSGLVGGVIDRSRADRLNFRFVGFLAPGEKGLVEYRVRLRDG